MSRPVGIDPDAFLTTDDGRVCTPERKAERREILCGLQGAGTSTGIARQRPQAGCV
ncbi:hypothetical protein ACN9MF_25715 [Methylobacterium fujisawaense]|uniref:hypothetical protein n=1 Tax=Methylobacterium fujisawaense TaxID=107400 RepID=UPI003CF4B556